MLNPVHLWCFWRAEDGPLRSTVSAVMLGLPFPEDGLLANPHSNNNNNNNNNKSTRRSKTFAGTNCVKCKSKFLFHEISANNDGQTDKCGVLRNLCGGDYAFLARKEGRKLRGGIGLHTHVYVYLNWATWPRKRQTECRLLHIHCVSKKFIPLNSL